MTEDDFLKRWSRRKREVAEAEKPAPSAQPADAKASPEHAASGEAAEKAEAEFDPATLPPIESITSVTDITAFLRAGVPADLTRAALRRVWTADPAIRDFVGLAENAWDFTDPNAMPGFGPLEDTDEVRRMIAQVIDGIGELARAPTGEESVEDTEVSKNPNDFIMGKAPDQTEGVPEQAAAVPHGPTESPAEISGRQVLLQSSEEDIAVQRDVTEDEDKPRQNAQRVHGGALPQ